MQNDQKAIEIFERAAQQGYIKARENIYNISFSNNKIMKKRKIEEVAKFYQRKLKQVKLE